MNPSLANRQQARARVDDRLLLGLPGRLTDRDRMLIRLVAEHRVLTTVQITDIGFCSQRRAESRLAQLYQLRVLDRFRPLTRTGSAPFHWLLDEAGAAVLAAEQGRAASQTSWRRDKDPGAAYQCAPGAPGRQQRGIHRADPHRPRPPRPIACSVVA